ncbi:MAG: glycosyl hydrolase 115 family protein, partial [Gemmatimonadaceae bacterium]
MNLLTDRPAAADFPLVQRRKAASIYVDVADFGGVRRAAGDLQADVERVSGVRPALVTTSTPLNGPVVIAGTLGKNAIIDQLVRESKVDVRAIRGMWESFVIATVKNPLPGVDRALLIIGSDKRGTIYGIYELSEQIGVSPWYWWADVPAQQHPSIAIKAGSHVQGPPAVKYRGIFINDEEPALGPWTREKFGGVNSKMYTHMFELILRLRGNYLWPAMWGKAFNEDDPANPRLADEYGIVMGTSHHEPMIRAQKEWTDHRKDFGNGEWDYASNAAGLQKFWSEGIERNKQFESVVTVGMRGDGDLPMPDAGSLNANKQMLEQIIADQRGIIASKMKRDAREVPQLWALFTEVLKYYDAGLRLPDDVTLLFTDDNVGNLRRVPTDEERARSGGAGIYFHMDMNGGPFSYKWLNSNPLPKVWEQMNLAYRYGANRIWIVNVGDLKPLEVPLEFFLRMAWNPEAMTPETIAAYQLRWATREFGPANAREIADLVAKYAKYNAWRKPELIRSETFSVVNYREAERVTETWRDLAARAKRLAVKIPV